MQTEKRDNGLAPFILVGIAVLIFMLLPFNIQALSSSNKGEKAVQEAAQPTQPAQGVRYFTLRTVLGQTPPMAFMGVGGEIDGVINPDLKANVGDRIRIIVINSDPVLHDFVIDEFKATTGQLTRKDQRGIAEFAANKPGEFAYYCSIPGHRGMGMVGKLLITGEEIAAKPQENEQDHAMAAVEPPAPTAAPAKAEAQVIVRDPKDVPPPVGDRAPMTLRVNLTTTEVTGVLADGTTFTYFTFDGKVPGPMLRVRVGDTIELYLRNAKESLLPHSIDLHSVTGPGGGAVYTQTNPGAETHFTFKALNPGLFVYHCATPSVAHHMANGMYGLILVEPEGGLPPVDREFYVMQGEIYTAQPYGTKGHVDFDNKKMLNEQPEYLVFNGAVGGLTADDLALRAKVGEKVRIYFGVGGPNLTSSFHVIGEIFDRVYDQASLTSEPLKDVQTTLVPPGGATVVEFKVEVPGRYILVDHALSRLERGLAGYLYVEGEPDPQVFHSDMTAASAGH